jgi:hypothetical protein
MISKKCKKSRQGYGASPTRKNHFLHSTNKSLEMGIIDDSRWMDSIKDRNLTSHNYDDQTAQSILCAIINVYAPLFNAFEEKMLPLSGL